VKLFESYKIKNITLRNRVVMPAMCQYTADTDGFANSWHQLHYGSRAVGGVGLIIVEATAVEKRGRLSNHDLGIWSDQHISGLQAIVDLCKSQGACIGIQLAHAGRKAWGNELVAPSGIEFSNQFPNPQALSKQDIAEIIEAWKKGARRANQAGFDLLQIHAAHGYLIHQFLSPLANQRHDEYGGSREYRLRFLLEIIAAIKEEWPAEKILSVRLSASDYLPGGLEIEDHVYIAQVLKEQGVDIIDVSSGGILPVNIETYPGYQVKFAEQIKQAVDIRTIAVGLISQVELAEEIIANQRADFVALGRELLRNPYWVLHATERLSNQYWPEQYLRARNFTKV